ncbi:MAG: cytochrome c [Spirochaetales bacterium]|nr:cytochrome c [Leptospiraceae bacterium]MCP5480468.1 cytochrome c [Spirochaetales bacterium]
MDHSNEKNSGGIPNWLLFLFFGAVLIGGLYAIYMHGFLGYDRALALRDARGIEYHVPTAGVYMFAQIPAKSPAAIASGEASYGQVCAACHGPELRGGVGPNLVDAEWLHMDSPTTLAVARRVVHGVSASESVTGGVMPQRGNGQLVDNKIWEVVYFIQSRNPSIADEEQTQ